MGCSKSRKLGFIRCISWHRSGSVYRPAGKRENAAVWLLPGGAARAMPCRIALSSAPSRFRPSPTMPIKPPIDNAKLDRIVAEARRNAEQRELGYRERALKMYPWVCGRCAREFTRANLQELTVHHRNHDHDYNPPDGKIGRAHV